MFDIKYSNQADKFLRKSDKILADRLLKKIEELRLEPITKDTKLISGHKEKLYRVRVGDYRILYETDYDNKIIGIVKIDKRERVYQ